MRRVEALLAVLAKLEVRTRAASAEADNVCKICGKEARRYVQFGLRLNTRSQ
jgi:hypothetical protein